MLQVGDFVPDCTLEYLDLIDMVVRQTRLTDSQGMIRLLSIVNSLERQPCHDETLHWEKLRDKLPAGACIFTVSMDLPYSQARWQAMHGVIHQTLSAWRNEQFGHAFGVWLKEWRLLQRAVLVIDQENRVVYTEYIRDQMKEPDYQAALDAVLGVVFAKSESFGSVKDI
jgi:thiol peroxidase